MLQPALKSAEHAICTTAVTDTDFTELKFNEKYLLLDRRGYIKEQQAHWEKTMCLFLHAVVSCGSI